MYREYVRFMVFGLGGGGGNIIDYMIEQGLKDVTFVHADTKFTHGSNVPNRFQLGVSVVCDGTNGNPEMGRHAAKVDEHKIRAFLQDYDMVFITAGMGGGTGTGAAPVVARIAKEMGILTVAVVTTPFYYEGEKRASIAQAGVNELLECADSVIAISNEKLLKVYGDLSVSQALTKPGEMSLRMIDALVQTIMTDGYINTDFNDIRTLMTNKGYAMMGVGRASGEGRVTKATQLAMNFPLLEDLRLENAKGLLVNLTAAQLMMNEPREVSDVIELFLDLEDNCVIYGFTEDESMGGDIHITIIITGLTKSEKITDEKPSSK